MSLPSTKPKFRPPRQLDPRQVHQILSRGGMLLWSGGVWNAYRNGDARRMRIGTVPDALAASLEESGAARRIAGPPLRLVAPV